MESCMELEATALGFLLNRQRCAPLLVQTAFIWRIRQERMGIQLTRSYTNWT